MNTVTDAFIRSLLSQRQPAPVGTPLPHEAAHLHVSGAARYVDDIPEIAGTLHAAPGCSTQAHARIRAIDLEAVRAMPDVVDVLVAADIPGLNDCGPVLRDDPILAADTVQFVGQPVFLVVARTRRAALRAARKAKIDYEPLEPVLGIAEAARRESYVLPPVELRRGDVEAAMKAAPHRLAGGFHLGGQEQFYLEGQISYAIPKEDGQMWVHCSTQHPTEMQHAVAHALHLPVNDVTVECRRMGGGFGGKESQSAIFACLAAVAAQRLRKPVKLRVDRDDDMLITGKRHDFDIAFDVAFDAQGLIAGLKLMLASRCGFSADLSGPVNDRTVFHSDNAYYLDAVAIRSLRCKTHTQSNTAFRGFGGPQGMIAIEYVIDSIARHLRLDPLDVRYRNLYGGPGRNTTHYGMPVEDNILGELMPELERSSRYRERRAEIARFNAASPLLKRGIALTPVKFGISFTATWYNQAGALVHVYTDGTVLVNHGGTEMGQGLNTKVRQVVAAELGVPAEWVRCTATDTSKVANTSATAASSGSDLNGKAAFDAARKIRERIVDYVARSWQVPAEQVRLESGQVSAGSRSEPWAQVVKAAYLARIQLWDSGFYVTPKIHYDPKTLTGRPFFYFAYGAAVSEVAIDTLTGETRVLRTDILHDVGRSINPAIDLGQIEGGFVQGMGWLTCEELWWNAEGKLMTHAPSTYKIPCASDVPRIFKVALFDNANREETIHRSKAVGEPPLMLALSVFFAIRDAIASTAPDTRQVPLQAPATPEAVLHALAALRHNNA